MRAQLFLRRDDRSHLVAIFSSIVALFAAPTAALADDPPAARAASPGAEPPVRPVRRPAKADLRVSGAPPPAAPNPAAPANEQDDLPKRVEKPASDGFVDRYVLETARIPALPIDPDFAVFSLHGEYELRFRAMNDLRLEPPLRGPRPTADGEPPKDPAILGQNAYLYHWARFNGRIVLSDDLLFVGQIDIPRGMIAGQTTQFVERSRDPLNDYNWYEVHPREMYVEYRSPIGIFRLGQQAGHWGQGLLANDGNHPQMFGDTIRGSLTERVLFATTPLGKDTPWLIVIAGDLVFEDNTADLLGDSPDQPTGDVAWQGVLATMLREDWAEIGVYGVIRHQSREIQEGLTPFDESLTVGVVDVAGKIRGRVPGTDAYAYLHGEAATIFGSTSYVRSAFVNQVDPGEELEDEGILSFGASATLGFVHVSDRSEIKFGDIVTELEWGYATGDADPFDGTTRRFNFDTNHNVGLVLFDHVLAWKTARSATIAQDERVTNRPNPGLQFLPSNGGVFGATYINPRILLRPVQAVDVKFGVVVAQATADFVDPYHAGALGDYANYDSGDPTNRDLGVELDTGVDVRIPLEATVSLELGAEGGVFFAGHAFDDDDGVGLDDQFLVNTKLGLQF